ncbi:hypothetical protein [Brucella intermedia]|uniref:hypothetical protein n=1 Tax=Brucella intermedia TaxID=94625 RepID=UPI00158D9810|nr:hypothetical protein [Brucella intermedia]
MTVNALKKILRISAKRNVEPLNDEARRELLAALKEAIDGDEKSLITKTSDLHSSDVLMIGTVIQLYCYADFSGRRIVDVLRHTALGKPRTASRLQDSQVFPMLIDLVNNHLSDEKLKQGLLIASEIVEMHRTHRHNFAHWICRRVKGENALIMFTMNSKEAHRRDGVDLDPQTAKYGILHLEGFDTEVEKLKEHTNYLARTSAWLDQNVDRLRDEFMSQK